MMWFNCVCALKFEQKYRQGIPTISQLYNWSNNTDHQNWTWEFPKFIYIHTTHPVLLFHGLRSNWATLKSPATGHKTVEQVANFLHLQVSAFFFFRFASFLSKGVFELFQCPRTFILSMSESLGTKTSWRAINIANPLHVEVSISLSFHPIGCII